MASLLDANNTHLQSKETYKQEKQGERDECNAVANSGVEWASQSPENLLALLNKMAELPNFTHRNCLIVMKQMPNARHLQTLDDWKRQKRRITPAQFDSPVMLLKPKPGTDFVDAVRYYDVSQTHGYGAPQKDAVKLQENTDEMQKAFNGLIKSSPVPIMAERDMDVPAMYDPASRQILVADGFPDYEAFAAMVQASTDAKLHQDDIHANRGRDNGYDPEGVSMITSCVTHTVCRRFGIPYEGAEVEQLHDLLSGLGNPDDPEATGKARNNILHMVGNKAKECGDSIQKELPQAPQRAQARPYSSQQR